MKILSNPGKQKDVKLDWSVCICLTQLYDGRDMYRIYGDDEPYDYKRRCLNNLEFQWRHVSLSSHEVVKTVLIITGVLAAC